MSTRITTGMTQRNILADLNRVNDRLNRTYQKISSNKEITRPSDDPFNASRALALRTSMESTQQYQRNIQDALGWQENAEIALSDITDAVLRARVLVVEAASDSTPPEARLAIAAELDQLIESIKQNANATYRGRYVFAGTATDAPPYIAGNDIYQGSPDDVERQIGPGVALPIGLLGNAVLGSGADGKLLAVMRDVSTHLAANDGAALRADIGLLDVKEDELLGVRALNGARQNRLEAALSRLTEVEESTLKQLSETEDVDIAKAMIEFSSQQAAYQAALKAGASIVQPSLMDFLR
ncbi:MAG TPA: flagellar hook-associated protein FlgL [Solirubrobacteraceae bacterium]|nr:flagellar hook-associated protein FlgL [Solirubrobacteraceae bacterium]